MICGKPLRSEIIRNTKGQDEVQVEISLNDAEGRGEFSNESSTTRKKARIFGDRPSKTSLQN